MIYIYIYMIVRTSNLFWEDRCPQPATAEVVANRLWLLECQALVRARRKLGHKSRCFTDTLPCQLIQIPGCHSQSDRLGNHGNDQPLRAKEACLQICGGPPDSTSFHCHLPVFVEAFEALGRWHTWSCGRTDMSNGLRETARLCITVHCYPLNAGLTGTAQEGNEDDEKARWNSTLWLCCSLMFIVSISSSLYRVFNPRWKTVITRPDGDSWLQPDWSTVWISLILFDV